MSIQQEVLHLMTERIRVLSRLKNLYLKKQRMVVDAHTEGREEMALVQRSCLDDMLNLESAWRSLVTRLKNAGPVSSDHTDVIISLSLKDEDVTEYFAYRDQLHQIVSEIERIKKNNELLSRNAIPLAPRKTRQSQGRAGTKLRSSVATSLLLQALPKNRSK